MNKTSKAATRSKPVKTRSKPLAAATVGGLTAKKTAKPAKKRSKSLGSSGKPERFIRQSAAVIASLPKPRPQKVPLAEVEVVAAAAIKKIKASRKLSPELKALRLAGVEESLERARTRFDGLSRAGVSMMRHAHEPPGWYDLEAVLA